MDTCPGAYTPTRAERRKALKPYEGQKHEFHWHRKLQQYYCRYCDLGFQLDGEVIRYPDGTWAEGH
jgi:hypothetical protein